MQERVFDLLRRCKLHPAHNERARAACLGGEKELLLRQGIAFELRVHNTEHVPKVQPAIQRRFPQGVEILVHVEDAGGLDEDAVIAAHGHRDEL